MVLPADFDPSNKGDRIVVHRAAIDEAINDAGGLGVARMRPEDWQYYPHAPSAKPIAPAAQDVSESRPGPRVTTVTALDLFCARQLK